MLMSLLRPRIWYRVAGSLRSIMQLTLFATTLMVTTGIALNLLAVELNGVMSLEGLMAIIDAVIILTLMFVYCFTSECVTSDLLGIDESFYNSPWYCLPVKRQKLLKLPIQRAQRAFRLSGLGLFDCSLVVFSSVRALPILRTVYLGRYTCS